MAGEIETPAHLTRLSIYSGTSYKTINGLRSFSLSSSDSSEDVTVNVDAGIARELVTKRQMTAKCEFNYLANPATGAADEGQAALIALAGEVGAASEGFFKIEWAYNTPVVRYFKATAKLDDLWGGATDINTLGVTLTLNSKLLTNDPKA